MRSSICLHLSLPSEINGEAPFTEAGRAIELRDVHKVIEQTPSRRERELLRLVELEGLTQKAAGEKLGISQPVAYEALKSGRKTLRELLLMDNALAPAKLSSTIEELSEPGQRDVIRLLYRDGLDPAAARKALRLSDEDFQALHRDALRTLKDLAVRESC